MCEDIMSAVCGTPSLHHLAATLDDYRRQPVIGQPYPGMVPAEGSQVRGVLYLDLAPSAWPRLDAFEGEEYVRRQVQVRLQDGSEESAWTYVFRPCYASRLADGAWDFERFLRTGKARFEALYLGFGKLGE